MAPQSPGYLRSSDPNCLCMLTDVPHPCYQSVYEYGDEDEEEEEEEEEREIKKKTKRGEINW
ncbi:hypothetical protein MTR_2g036660 [Medicago truncatula]|uniref:Uncharacterized protein n=1 Tax=Medicago truncatula TaxID=3880 RepID=G7IN03_MEDTR|nr:hypothetical protein MTR_2g036660 [Medicago truncatula]